VNRPFYAFGVLMAFLALAMLAIGLSSRPAGKSPSAGGSGSELPRRQPGVTLFVLVLPDAETADILGLPTDEDLVVGLGGCGMTTQHPSYAQGCGLERATGNVYFAPTRSPISSAADDAVAQTGLRTATIEPAGPVNLDDVVRNSLATGYDAAYDRAMTAEPVGQRDELSLAPAMSDPTALEQDDPLLVVFNSLSRRETTESEQKSHLARLRQRRWDYEARAILSGAQNRVWRLFIAAGVADEWRHAAQQTGLIGATQANHQPGPTWAEYMAWIGSKQWTVAGRDTQNGRSVPFWNLPSDELLQIAVAGLNRVAELLHKALVQLLDEAAERIAGRTDRAAAGSAPK
jgi:hypothetical protein